MKLRFLTSVTFLVNFTSLIVSWPVMTFAQEMLSPLSPGNLLCSHHPVPHDFFLFFCSACEINFTVDARTTTPGPAGTRAGNLGAPEGCLRPGRFMPRAIAQARGYPIENVSFSGPLGLRILSNSIVRRLFAITISRR